MRFFVILLCLMTSLPALAQPKKHLVIGVVVDQMRQDYLYRYQDRFCDSGFKRIMNEGFVSHNCQYNYIPTYTGPGHASIYTGTTPAFHGIVANDWYDREKGDMVYCTQDDAIRGSAMNKGMSPNNLKATTITDQLALASQFRSKIIGVSLKDRSSILPAGHHPTGAYWFDSRKGGLISSSFYQDSLPEWVNEFNRRALPLIYMENTWNPLFPIETYKASASDSNAYESRFDKTKPPVFPYDLNELQKSWGYKLMNFTPYGNDYVVEAAKAAIEANDMGKHEDCDFLCMSFSATDYAGHFFGPQAIEVEDIYLRLDRQLAAFLSYLDNTLGKGNYTLFLTADHGGNEVPRLLQDHDMPGGLLEAEKWERKLKEHLRITFGDTLVDKIANDQIYLNHTTIASKKLKLEVVISEVRNFIQDMPGILKSYSAIDLNNGVYGGHPMDKRVYMGYQHKLCGDVLILTQPGWMDYGPTGTSHGSAFNYDTRVPFMILGPKVKKGASYKAMEITDIAPTIAAILNLAFPNACVGQVNTEVLKN